MTQALALSPVEQVVTVLRQPQALLLTGTEAVYRVALRGVARLAERHPVVYLDGANTFDPYALVREALWRRLPVERVLASVFVRRAFTCYQMNEMVRRIPLERVIRRRAVLVIAGPCTTYFDESVPGHRAARLFYQMFYRLQQLSRSPVPLLVVQSNLCPAEARRYFLTDLRRLSPRVLEVDDFPTALISERRSEALPVPGESPRGASAPPGNDEDAAQTFSSTKKCL